MLFCRFTYAKVFSLAVLASNYYYALRSFGRGPITYSTALKMSNVKQMQPIGNPFNTPNPSVAHQILSEAQVGSRLIIIGDVHGCLDELKQLLTDCNYSACRDTLMFVGDLVNKGPYSAEVVRFIQQLQIPSQPVHYGVYCVRGNHDESALSHALGTNSEPRSPVYDYVSGFTEKDIDFLKELPYTISVPSYNTIVVHAGLVPGVQLDQQTVVDMCTMRNVLENDDDSYYSGTTSAGSKWEGTASDLEGLPWAKVWGQVGFEGVNPPHVFFGHDAKRMLQQETHATGLDTGCCYGKKLTAVILPERTFVQVDARSVYEEPKIKLT